MPDRLSKHQPRAPLDRFKQVNSRFIGHLFPGEVADALTMRNIDYAELRRLYRLIRQQDDHPVDGRTWSRYTFADVAALMMVLELCGGHEALMPGRRLNHRNVALACEALISQGIRTPLLSVRLVRRGWAIYAEVGGVLLDPRNGQLLLEQAAAEIDSYFDHTFLKDPDLAQALTLEIRRHRSEGGGGPTRRVRRRTLSRHSLQPTHTN